MDLSIRKYPIVITLTFLLQSALAQATDVVYVPGYCDPEKLILKVENKSDEMQRLWTQVRAAQEIQEQHFDFYPGQTLHISGDQFLRSQQGFSLRSWTENSLKITSECEDTQSIPLTRTTSPEVTHLFPPGTKTIRLHVLNLFLKENKINLKAFSKTGNLIEEKHIALLKNYDTKNLKWNFSQDVAQIKISGLERLHSMAFYDSQKTWKPSPSVAFTPKSLKVDSQKHYFLVGTKSPDNGESFVVAIEDLQVLQEARKQINNPHLEKIIVAGIELGHGNFNRSLSAQDRSPYSWSVHRIDAFADFAHISCDGSPDLIEERLQERLDEGGRICFWRYRILKELTPEEVASGRLKP